MKNEDILFFATPAEFRKWLSRHHAKVQEQWVGFHKRGSGKPSITWPQSVDEALCFGWIDGLRRSIDGDSYKIRFTPRRPTSIWSEINIRKIAELTKAGKMQPAGLHAFSLRKEGKSGTYSFEAKSKGLDPAYEKQIRANKAAWKFFEAQAPWYRRTAGHWVMSAKREETRLRRLALLIEDCAAGKKIGPLRRPGAK